MATVLWIIAVVLVISGIVTLLRGEMVYGIVLIVVGLLVGPGGVSVFTDSAPSEHTVVPHAVAADAGTQPLDALVL